MISTKDLKNHLYDGFIHNNLRIDEWLMVNSMNKYKVYEAKLN